MIKLNKKLTQTHEDAEEQSEINSKILKILKEHFITKKTPAVTIVAACNKADTGVGPSIASGNHICKPI